MKGRCPRPLDDGDVRPKHIVYVLIIKIGLNSKNFLASPKKKGDLDIEERGLGKSYPTTSNGSSFPNFVKRV